MMSFRHAVEKFDQRETADVSMVDQRRSIGFQLNPILLSMKNICGEKSSALIP